MQERKQLSLVGLEMTLRRRRYLIWAQREKKYFGSGFLGGMNKVTKVRKYVTCSSNLICIWNMNYEG